jgi:hypothetical protein
VEDVLLEGGVESRVEDEGVDRDLEEGAVGVQAEVVSEGGAIGLAGEVDDLAVEGTLCTEEIMLARRRSRAPGRWNAAVVLQTASTKSNADP